MLFDADGVYVYNMRDGDTMGDISLQDHSYNGWYKLVVHRVLPISGGGGGGGGVKHSLGNIGVCVCVCGVCGGGWGGGWGGGGYQTIAWSHFHLMRLPPPHHHIIRGVSEQANRITHVQTSVRAMLLRRQLTWKQQIVSCKTRNLIE